MKIVIFSGSFDPITTAHKELARLASVYYRNALVYWCISNKPHFISYNARLELIKASVQNANIIPMDNSMYKFLKALPYNPNDLTILIGTDTINTIRKWDNYDNLIKEYHFTIGGRNGTKFTKLDTSTLLDMKYTYLGDFGKTSSTQVRKLIRMNRSITGLVPREVKQQIKELYK